MIVTNIQIRDAQTETRLDGVASVTFDSMIVVHDIKIINNREEGYFLAMPSRKLPNGTFKDIAHPISKEARAAIENMVIGCFGIMRSSGSEYMAFVYRDDAGKSCLTEQVAEDFTPQTAEE